MNRLLIPAHFIELTGLVQNCLFAAEEQGFDISKVELGVSPAPYFELNLEGRSLRFSPDSGQSEAIHLNYAPGDRASNGNGEASLVAGGLSLQQVVFGAQYQDGFADLWLNSEGNICAVCYENRGERESHLAWLMTALVLDFPLEDALMLARAATKTGVSRETWPTDPELFPTPVLDDPALGIRVNGLNKEQFLPTDRADLGFYPVVDSAEWVERLLKLGVKTVQLRIKNPSQPDLEQQIEIASALGREYKAQLFINDYWQLAIKHEAYGVHLGQEDLEVADLDAIQSAGIRLGLSTHGYYELMRIRQLQPSYIALGHIFPTTTKQMPSKPQGLVRLARYQRLSAGIPTVAIGGIDLTNAEQVLACGVDSLAVVRAVTQSSEPEKVFKAFTRLLEQRFEKSRENANAL